MSRRSVPSRLLIALSLSAGLAYGPVASAESAAGQDPATMDFPDVPDVPDVPEVPEVPDSPAESVEPAPLEGAKRLDADGLFAGEQAAYRHYMQGKKALEGGEPNPAIAAWERGVAELPDERPYARSRGALALSLVRAHQLRYRKLGEPVDLERQISLLRGYQARLPEIFPDDSAARDQRHALAAAGIEQASTELDRIGGEHGTVDEQLESSLRGEYSARTEESWDFDPLDLGWHPRPDDPRKHGAQATDVEAAPEQAIREDPTEALEPRKAGTGLIVSGAILTAAGLGGLAAGFAGMGAAAGANDFAVDQTPADRAAQIDRGERGNQQALAGLIAGGAVVGVGVALLAVGATKRKRSGRTVALRPAGDSTCMGVTIAGRF